MKLIKSLFIATMAMIMTTIAGSAITHLFDETQDAQHGLDLLNIFRNSAYAEETMDTEDDILEEENNTFTTSLNTYTPSTVIDENILPTPQDNSQSPEQKEEATTSEYVNILANLVPISGEDMDYEKILGISEEEIKSIIETYNKNIWDIAEDADEIELLEKAYCAIYPARIIEMLEQNIITQEMADLLIEQANDDIANHTNTSVGEMIDTMLNSDLS